MSSEAENKRLNCSSGKDVLERTWTISQTFRKRERFCKGKTTFMELCRYFQSWETRKEESIKQR
jgi:hypothetical protein